jgi:hypothetical protein
MVSVCIWPEYKVRFHASVEGAWVGLITKRFKNTEPRRQMYLGHVPKVFREPISGFHD